MYQLPPSAQKLVRALSRLPSIGERTATRLAYFLITQEKEIGNAISESIKSALQDINLCKRCFFLSEGEICNICSDSSRDSSILCIVEKPIDLISIERMGEFKGLYHVLHGLWAPLKGKGAESLRLAELFTRIASESIKEIIIATGSTVEGDATAVYISQQLKNREFQNSDSNSGLQNKIISATRLAQGMPKGADLEYADDLTLSRAFSGRSVM